MLNYVTIINVHSTIDDVVDLCEGEDYNELLIEEYADHMITLARYAQMSPNIGGISYPLSKIEYIIKGTMHDKIGKEQLKYLIRVRDKLRVFRDKINSEFEEIEEVSIDRIKIGIFGIFRKSNVDELKDIFDGYPSKVQL
ncbi:hypothetical protein OXPF_00090 [Oxobacter pfennigii]|uniref:Uncharacterized protein n=2 Tax=Oxobacter pfennigii TaxID=36849 RepID=A0A0P8X616_9CLOT|nr:hypothetical protein OXPF_00090 [Oxobacter pfennigii]